MSTDTYKEKLYYSCRDDMSEDWAPVAPPPKKIMFELTNGCNHRCYFCSNLSMKREVGFLDRDAYRKIATEARQLGVEEVALYTTGESLLHEEIVDFVKIAKELGFSYIYLSSNGALLSPELSRQLILAGLDSLRISINAGTRENYKRVHGHDEFDLVIANIREFDRIRKELGAQTLLSASCVVTKKNSDETRELEKAIGPYTDAIKWTEIRVQGGTKVNNVVKLTTKDMERDERYKLKPCGLLWNGMHVDYDGNLTLCCVDFDAKMVVGNVLEEGLENCWNNHNMQSSRKAHLEGTLRTDSLCYKCLTGKKS